MSILKLTSDTLVGTPATGNIEYNGQFFGTDSNNSRAQMQRLVLATSQTASGTSIDFTGIPAWAKRITVIFNAVSTNSTSPIIAQLGTAGSPTTSGYDVVTLVWGSAPSNTFEAYTTGFGTYINPTAASHSSTGHLILTKIDGNTWIGSGSFKREAANGSSSCNGSISLSGTLDNVRITSVSGSATFDAGTINILYEG